jgi:hypothetical protein
VLERLTMQLVDDLDIDGGTASKVALTMATGNGAAIQTNDDLEIESVNTTNAGETRLRASGNITDVAGSTAAITTGGNLVLDSGGSIGTQLTPLRTTVSASAALLASAVGTLTLRQLGNGLRVAEVLTGVDAVITVVTGDLTVGRIQAPTSVTLTTQAGSILDGLDNTADTDGNVLTDTLTLTATGGSIGSAVKPLDTTVDTLTATATNDVSLVNRGPLVAQSVTAATGDVTLRTIDLGVVDGTLSIGAITATAGDVTLTSSDALLHLAGNAIRDVTALTLVIDAASGIATSAAPIDAQVGRLEARTTTGGLWLTNAGSLIVGGIGTMVGLSAAGEIDVSTSAGSLTVDEAIDSGAGPVDLVAVTSTAINAAITTGGGSAAVSSGTSVTFGATGSIDTESGASGVSVVANTGAIGMDDGSFVNARNGLITLFGKTQVRISLLTTATDVTVTSDTADIVDTTDSGALDITAANALLKAATGIGPANALELAVARLEAAAGSGGIWANDTNGLTIGGITSSALPGATSTTGLLAGGAIVITTTGFLRVVENVRSTGASVSLEAIDSALVDGGTVAVPETLQQTATSASDGSDADEDLSVVGSLVQAATTIVLLAGDDMLIDATSSVIAGTSAELRVDWADADSGTGARLDVLGALAGPDVLADGGRDGDVFYLHPTAIATHLQVKGDRDGLPGGRDLFVVDSLPSIDTARKLLAGQSGPASLVTGNEATVERFRVDLDGRGGSDGYIVRVTGTSDYIVDVHDSGAQDDGADELTINGTAVADNVFLVREGFVTRMQAAGAGFGPNYERINYDESINAMRINGGTGSDRFYLDDNSAILTVDGAAGDDRFQIGQLFGYDRRDDVATAPSWVVGATTVPAQVAPGDEIRTVETTRGFLSRGISFSTTIYGGDGDDDFQVYGNQAVLKLFGENDDDEFIIRAFALAGSTHTASEQTDLAGGAGDDLLE